MDDLTKKQVDSMIDYSVSVNINLNKIILTIKRLLSKRRRDSKIRQ